MNEKRERWSSKLGVILAVAGSAVGLGNFLRFPAKATLNGGGAFMIPYFVAFLLLGIPLMWIEWSIGRIGGQHGHGTAPGMFDALSKWKFLKYLGTIGVLGPFIILIYYMYIESWTLAYAFFSFSNELMTVSDQSSMQAFLSAYQGLTTNEYFSGIGAAFIFFAITFLLNFYFIYKGVQGGIEKLSRWGMPLLIIIGIILAVRVLTLGTPDPQNPDLSISNALGFVWNPQFDKLFDIKVWLEAAGQIFFTLSVGIGVILTYASYLKREEDVVLSGLAAASTNEFCEVILGGSIVIPAAFVFFGAAGAIAIAKGGIFNIGFVTMPLIFQKLPLGFALSGLWFLLLFIAGITSSVSLIQPAMSFLEDELKLTREKATILLAIVAFVCCLPTILFLKNGFLDELDFWGGTMFLVLFAAIEVILFVWVFGVDNAWNEMHRGAKIKIPIFYKYVIKYITPLYLLVLLGVWSYQYLLPTIRMTNVSDMNKPYIWGARILILTLWIAIIITVSIVWRKRKCEATK